ncbi:unnamed protein product [Medioppia subpectinata]|uniref:NR LBD domain-containing protein n=1 Tax=Medioppia subpectinata TaxID=1979941 RepID=A0A7R9L6E4_9ACAR|nr:unnamed protein product [Medioppia subpectinata]CAG2115347.1 unnamed protein product [Medioppia subpectinata]
MVKYSDKKQTVNNEITTTSETSTVSSQTEVMGLCGKNGTNNTSNNNLPAIIRGFLFDLNDLERTRLKQLFSSATLIRDPVVTMASEANTGPEILRVFQIRTEIHFRRIIKMCKTMTEFTELSETDQIILLKTSCPEIICLLNILTYDFVGEFWTLYIGYDKAAILRMDILRQGIGHVYDFQKSFMFKLNQEYNQDINLMNLEAQDWGTRRG